MNADFTPLRQALNRYRNEGIALPIWWRDDDAIAATPQLEQLGALSTSLQMPVHLAVVPNRVEASLPPFLSTTDMFVPVAHGWRHSNTAPPNAKKSEFGHAQSDGPHQIINSYLKMHAHFGPAFVPLFVPPWNRIDVTYFPDLARAGFRGLSTYGPRPAILAAEGLLQINTHVDPIFWRGTRDLKDPDVLIAETVDLLEKRRTGEADSTEPLGYLTHHLVHTPSVWEFSRRFLQELLQGGATPQPIADLIGHSDEQT